MFVTEDSQIAQTPLASTPEQNHEESGADNDEQYVLDQFRDGHKYPSTTLQSLPPGF